MRRLVMTLLAIALVATGCSSGLDIPGVDPSSSPDRRVVSAGYETVTDADATEQLAQDLDEVDADSVAISAGRADWAAFQWPDNEDRWATPVSEDDDPFGDASSLLGQDRSVIAVVDVFAGSYLEENPELAAQTADGDELEFQVSIGELTEGEHGDAIVEMAAALASRDDVDAVNLTELHYDVGGFGPDDEALYSADTGEDGWPRDEDDEIDTEDPSIGQWRSERIAGFVERVADAVHEHDAELLLDVRAPRDGDAKDAVKYGQDYELLLEHADRLVVWHYVALGGADGSDESQQTLDALVDLGPERIIVSLGLWGDDDETMPADQLADEMARVHESGLKSMWITPASLLEEDHWEVLREQWPLD